MASMKNLRKLLLLLLPLAALAGCASVADRQMTCEEKYSYFPDMVTCLKEDLDDNFTYHYGRKRQLTQIYLAYADRLAEEVKNNQISEATARQYLAELYFRLNHWTQWQVVNDPPPAAKPSA